MKINFPQFDSKEGRFAVPGSAARVCVVCSRIPGMCEKKVTAQRRSARPRRPRGPIGHTQTGLSSTDRTIDDSSPSVTFGAGKEEKEAEEEKRSA